MGPENISNAVSHPGTCRSSKREADKNPAISLTGAGVCSGPQSEAFQELSNKREIGPCLLSLEIEILAEKSEIRGSGRGVLPNQELFSDQCQQGETRYRYSAFFSAPMFHLELDFD